MYINHENAFSTQFNKRNALCYCVYMVDVPVSVCATAKCVCLCALCLSHHIYSVTTIAVAVAVVIIIVFAVVLVVVVVMSVRLLRNCTLNCQWQCVYATWIVCNEFTKIKLESERTFTSLVEFCECACAVMTPWIFRLISCYQLLKTSGNNTMTKWEKADRFLNGKSVSLFQMETVKTIHSEHNAQKLRDARSKTYLNR